MRVLIILLISSVTFFGCSNAQNSQTVQRQSAKEFQQSLQNAKTAQIIDVRTPQEFKKGHIKNAMNLNINGSEFKSQMATLDKSQPVYVYCLSGGRSSSAVRVLQSEGFSKIIEMPGGMMEWRSQNLPEVSAAAHSKGMSMQEYESLLKSDKLILVDFYADWCAPCKKMEPYLSAISQEMKDRVVVLRINADENTELCKTMKVSSLPVLKLYKDNVIVWENTGFVDEAKVREQLK